MKVSVPAAGGRPVRITSFACYTYIIVQIIGAQTLRLGASDAELQQTSDQGIQDGLQFNQANTTPPYGMWWKGDLWALSNGAAFNCVIETPGAGNQLAAPSATVTPGYAA
jgi:hypothetical protein